jgi:hypothetical protein
MLTMCRFFIFILLLASFNSCKDDALVDPVLFGTWNVTKVQGQQYVNGIPGLLLTDNNPTGYVRFDEDGNGEQNYSFTIFGTTYPNVSEFSWEADDAEIRIDRFNQADMVWRRITNDINKQEARYLIQVDATQSWDYTLTLER